MRTNSLFRLFLSLYLGMTFVAVGFASTLLYFSKSTEPQPLLIRSLIALAVFIFASIAGVLFFAKKMKQLAAVATEETKNWQSNQKQWLDLKQTLQDDSSLWSIPVNVTNDNAHLDSWTALQNEINKVVTTMGATHESQDDNSIESLVGSIEDLNKGNETIISEVKRSTNQMKEIVAVISEIGAKTKVINDIVFQTKLLSFNASVEAARAGEQGKGFAVVAEEVGNLAHMSGQAAREITTMLDESIRKVDSISSETQKSLSGLVEANEAQIKRSLEQAQGSIQKWKSWKEQSQQHSDEIKKLDVSARDFNDSIHKKTNDKNSLQPQSNAPIRQKISSLVQLHEAQLNTRQKVFEKFLSYIAPSPENKPASPRELDSWTPAPARANEQKAKVETKVVKLPVRSPKKTEQKADAPVTKAKGEPKVSPKKIERASAKSKPQVAQPSSLTGALATKELPEGLPNQDDPRFQDI